MLKVLMIISITACLFVFIIGLCFLLVGKSVCLILGHDWKLIKTNQEEVNEGKETKVVEVYKCQQCHMIQERISYWSEPDPNYEPEF